METEGKGGGGDGEGAGDLDFVVRWHLSMKALAVMSWWKHLHFGECESGLYG